MKKILIFLFAVLSTQNLLPSIIFTNKVEGRELILAVIRPHGKIQCGSLKFGEKIKVNTSNEPKVKIILCDPDNPSEPVNLSEFINQIKNESKKDLKFVIHNQKKEILKEIETIEKFSTDIEKLIGEHIPEIDFVEKS